MRLNAPKKITWVVALILGIIGVLAHFFKLPPVVDQYEFWFLGVGWLLLVLSTWLKGF